MSVGETGPGDIGCFCLRTFLPLREEPLLPGGIVSHEKEYC